MESSNTAVAKNAEDGGTGTSLHDETSIEELRGTVMRPCDVVMRQQNTLQAEAGIPGHTLRCRLKFKPNAKCT